MGNETRPVGRNGGVEGDLQNPLQSNLGSKRWIPTTGTAGSGVPDRGKRHSSGRCYPIEVGLEKHSLLRGGAELAKIQGDLNKQELGKWKTLKEGL